MGCSESKDQAPRGAAAPARRDPYQQPYPPQGGGYGGQQPAPAYQHQYHGDPYQSHRDRREQTEVQQAHMMISQRQQQQHMPPQTHASPYQSPPPTQPYYQPQAQPQPTYYHSPPPASGPPQHPDEDGPLVTPREDHRKTAEILEAQRFAGVDQLQEVYPNIDRAVIEGVVQDCGGNMELCHNALSEMSPAPANGGGGGGAGAGGDAPRSSSPPPVTRSWQVGDRVEAMFQGSWFRATIESIELNGDYNVAWEEDGSHTLVMADHIRGPTH
eukprot:TRINITY_DN710_c2_g4_i1.p1 TRINITY_DN710_c2_g4~~TRINITY_DN710_c2_g4_i1.p1  ORF type:complete len:271 (+),score=74.58 TRINITY_DN710_c2_g4_i1:291-1103(+)